MISREDAEEFTQGLGQVMGGGFRLIAYAQKKGIPKALELTTEQWVNQRLGGYLKLPIPERREAVKELTKPEDQGGLGMSQRDAAAALGVDEKTIRRDQGAANAAPESSEPVPKQGKRKERAANAARESDEPEEPEQNWGPGLGTEERRRREAEARRELDIQAGEAQGKTYIGEIHSMIVTMVMAHRERPHVITREMIIETRKAADLLEKELNGEA